MRQGSGVLGGGNDRGEGYLPKLLGGYVLTSPMCTVPDDIVLWKGWHVISEQQVTLMSMMTSCQQMDEDDDEAGKGRNGRRQGLLRGLAGLRHLAHPNVAALYEVIATRNAIYFSMEPVTCPLQDVRNFHNCCTEAEVSKYAEQVLNGLSYIANSGYLCTLLPGNIMWVQSNNTAKILPTGLTKVAPSSEPNIVLSTTLANNLKTVVQIVVKLLVGDEAGDTGSAIHIGQGQGDSDISWPLTLDAYPLSDVCKDFLRTCHDLGSSFLSTGNLDVCSASSSYQRLTSHPWICRRQHSTLTLLSLLAVRDVEADIRDVIVAFMTSVLQLSAATVKTSVEHNLCDSISATYRLLSARMAAGNRLPDAERMLADPVRRSIIDKVKDTASASRPVSVSKQLVKHSNRVHTVKPVVSLRHHKHGSTVFSNTAAGNRNGLVDNNNNSVPAEQDALRQSNSYYKDSSSSEKLLSENNNHGTNIGDSLEYRQSLLKLKYMRSHDKKLSAIIHQPPHPHPQQQQHPGDKQRISEEGGTQQTNAGDDLGPASMHPTNYGQPVKLRPAYFQPALTQTSAANKPSVITRPHYLTHSIRVNDVQQYSDRVLSMIQVNNKNSPAAASDKRDRELEEKLRLVQNNQRLLPSIDDIMAIPLVPKLQHNQQLAMIDRHLAPPLAPPNSSRDGSYYKRQGGVTVSNGMGTTHIVVYLPNANSDAPTPAPTPTPPSLPSLPAAASSEYNDDYEGEGYLFQEDASAIRRDGSAMESVQISPKSRSSSETAPTVSSQSHNTDTDSIGRDRVSGQYPNNNVIMAKFSLRESIELPIGPPLMRNGLPIGHKVTGGGARRVAPVVFIGQPHVPTKNAPIRLQQTNKRGSDSRQKQGSTSVVLPVASDKLLILGSAEHKFLYTNRT